MENEQKRICQLYNILDKKGNISNKSKKAKRNT